jgi:taurine dioxygenase
MADSGIRIERLGRNLGARVHGADLSKPLSDADFAAIHAALAEHEMLLFRDQDIDAAAQLAFGRRFGPPSVHPFSPNLAEMPELIVLDNHQGNPPRLTDIWHSDETFRAEPPMATILRATITPELGGDTMFASMSAAFDGLADQLQHFLSGLEAVHDFKPFRGLLASDADGHRRLRGLEAEFPLRHHPVVRVHPESGRKVIFVNPQFTIGTKGMADAEGQPLLAMLFDLAKVPEYQFRLRWKTNTLAIWDNRAVQHYAIHDYYPQRRRMERITIRGDRPFGVDDARRVPLIPRQAIAAEGPSDGGPEPLRQVYRKGGN